MASMIHAAFADVKAMTASSDEALAYQQFTRQQSPTTEQAVASRNAPHYDPEKLSVVEEDVSGESDEDSHALLPGQTLSTLPNEYTVSTSRKTSFLVLYFLLSLGLTLSNKAIMTKAKLPWLLTVLHTSCTSIGSSAMLATGRFQLSRLSMKENLILTAFSSLFTLNIAISNVSLALVSVPFHQVLRSTCPVATILIYLAVYKRAYSRPTYLSMIPLIFGVALATFGDYYFSILGFTLTLLGVFLAAIKTVATNRLMTGSLDLSAMEILFRMSPLAALQCLLYAAASGEFGTLVEAHGAGKFDRAVVAALLCNGTTAFVLNVVSFQTNKVAGALTMSVTGNIKQCMTIVLGIVLFAVKVSPLNGFGMAVTVAGAAWYSKVELDRKRVPT